MYTEKRVFSLVKLLFIVFLLDFASFSTDAGDTPDVPNLGEAIKTYLAKRPNKKLTDHDLAVIKNAQTQIAEEVHDPGLQAGEHAPDFTLMNAFGKKITLSELLKDGPVVLTFYRGSWCPFCNLQLHALNQSLPLFQPYHATLVFITPQRPDKSKEQLKKEDYSFEILSDLDNMVMKAYRLFYTVPPDLVTLYKNKFQLDLAEYNGPDRYVLPVPGTFVIDTDGIIRAAYADLDYKKRMEPMTILNALKDIAAH